MKEREETKRQSRPSRKGPSRQSASETPERRPNDVEFLMLALVQNGLRSAYDFKKRAGISVGTSIPALGRLHDAGLLDLSETNQRNARRYLITASGAQTLKDAWRTCLSSPTADVDSIIRIGYLAWTLGNDREASEFLQRAASTLQVRATTIKAEASESFNGVQHELPGSAYRWLRTYCDAVRLHACAGALTQLADQIGGIGQAKSGREEKQGSGGRSRR